VPGNIPIFRMPRLVPTFFNGVLCQDAVEALNVKANVLRVISASFEPFPPHHPWILRRQ